MTGVVLCGGQSSRMGTDKGLMQWNDQSWTQIAASRFRALGLPFVLSVNDQNHLHYHTLFPEQALVRDDATLPVGGPLKGLLSVHQQLPAEDLLVLAVDLPLMQDFVLQKLLEAYNTTRAEAYLFGNNDRREPLVAIYTSRALERIFQSSQQGQLQRSSLHYVLDQLQTHIIPLEPHFAGCFENFNRPEDLPGLHT